MTIPQEAARLALINSEVARFTEVVGRLTSVTPGLELALQTPSPTVPGASAKVSSNEGNRADPRTRAVEIYKLRRQRENELQVGHGLFSEPAWDILLDLFVHACDDRRVSVTSCCIAASVPPTTALRHIAALVEAGHLERTPDRYDQRRAFVALTPEMQARMSDLLS